jgi:outer membrane protein assembly factor BamB
MVKIKNKTIAILIAAIFITCMTAATALIPNTYAHTPSIKIPTYTFMSVSPNPIGQGQQVNLNFWVNQPPPTASAQYGDRWGNMTVIVTHPDGTKETLGPFTSDATGGSHTIYTPSVVGNYTFQMSFGGQTLTGQNLAPGTATSGPFANAFIGDYFQPSTSNVFTLNVQQDPIAGAAVAPLPSNYWTRPIYGENNNWYSISGNWLGLGTSTFAATGMYNQNGNYNPYTPAPNTSHIIWTKPEAFGGIIGGEFGSSETANYYSTSQYEPKFAPIIMQGILYYTVYPGASTFSSGWVAVDLHTGQTLWTKTSAQVNGEVLRCGQIFNEITPNQYGAQAYLWSEPASASGFMAAGAYMSMYDAMTGNWILNITNTPALTLTEDDHGDLIGYYVNSSTNPLTFQTSGQSLSMWNSTADINIGLGGSPSSGYPSGLADNWMWRPTQGAQIDFKYGVEWSKPLSNNVSGVNLYDNGISLAISAVSDNAVVLTGTNLGFSAFLYEPGWEIETGYSAIDGHQLWAPVNRTLTPYSIVYSSSLWSGSGVYVELTESTLSIAAYNLNTGVLAWGPIALPNVSPFSSLGANAVVANGTIYIWLYGGDVYAYNLGDGSLKWQYHTPSGGYESPYGVEPLWTFTVGTVADGKLFVPEGHMYSPPLFHNAQQLALNITDGKVIWSIDAFDVTSAPAISDGVMTTLNAYDNQVYGYGKGPTKVTVNAPAASIEQGKSLVISGTVTDISAGAQQQAVAANFPNGLPAVSDTSMSLWMEHVYMQQPFQSNTTGVPVSLSVIDTNGNTRPIGSATTDSTGAFSYQWTPDITGKYTVIATFTGSESYYPASSEASFGVDQPAPTSSPAATPVTSSADLYFVPLSVGLIVVVLILAALVVLSMIRKRP